MLTEKNAGIFILDFHRMPFFGGGKVVPTIPDLTLVTGIFAGR